MNNFRIRTKIGEHRVLTLNYEEKIAMSQLFRKKRQERKHSQKRVGAIYKVAFQVISDWEHAVRITPYAEACMRDYIAGDLSALANFVDSFQKTHYVMTRLLAYYSVLAVERFDMREAFIDSIYDLKVAFYALKDFDKISLYKNLDFFLNLEAYDCMLDLMYSDEDVDYRDCVCIYYSYFIAAQQTINDLLRLYGSSLRVTIDNDKLRMNA